jgi:hypothetical protein
VNAVAKDLNTIAKFMSDNVAAAAGGAAGLGAGVAAAGGGAIDILSGHPIRGARSIFSAPGIAAGVGGAVGGITIQYINDVPVTSKKVEQKFIASSIKIFPNPAPSGASLNIDFKEIPEGDYNISFLTLSGQLVRQEQLRIDAGMRTLQLAPNLKAGGYFMVLTNKKTGKKFTEKILIQ